MIVHPSDRTGAHAMPPHGRITASIKQNGSAESSETKGLNSRKWVYYLWDDEALIFSPCDRPKGFEIAPLGADEHNFSIKGKRYIAIKTKGKT